jgi:hypothetical protein
MVWRLIRFRSASISEALDGVAGEGALSFYCVKIHFLRHFKPRRFHFKKFQPVKFLVHIHRLACDVTIFQSTSAAYTVSIINFATKIGAHVVDIKLIIEGVPESELRVHLREFLIAFTQPAFGALPKREIELKVFELIKGIGAIDEKASIYSLMTDLRITRSKATQMLFDLEVRKDGGNTSKLDNEIRDALRRSRFAKDGEYFVMEMESPLALAHFRQRIRELGHVSDTSFNASIVRASLDAVVDLMLELIPKDGHEGIRAALEKAGAPPGTAKSILRSALKELGRKCVGGAADTLVDLAADNFIGPLIDGAKDLVVTNWKAVFVR